MANLTVTIVVRTRQDGKRRWFRATGKNDPPGPLYLRYCQGSTPRYVKGRDSYDEAEMAQIRFERKLKAQSQGFVVPEKLPTLRIADRISDVITAYLADLRPESPSREIRQE